MIVKTIENRLNLEEDILRVTFGWLINSAPLMGCKGKDNDGMDVTDTTVENTGSRVYTAVAYSASTFAVDLRSDEVYEQGQTHSG